VTWIELLFLKIIVMYILLYMSDVFRLLVFLQVSRLYRALILLGLALCLPSTSVLSVFMVLYIHCVSKNVPNLTGYSFNTIHHFL